MSNSVTSVDLASTGEPWLVVAGSSDSFLRDQVERVVSCGIVRWLNPENMRDEAGIFVEFAERLDFPAYFGHSWYALADCLDDLHASGHGLVPVVVAIPDADSLVDKEFFPLLVAILCEAAERANLSLDSDGIPREKPPIPLHFVLFVKRCKLMDVADRLRGRDDLSVQESEDRLLVRLGKEPE